MKKTDSLKKNLERAFTLIELLVVIAIIGILAALLFPATAAIKKKQMLSLAKVELQQVVLAIESYKSSKGFYPPDNPGNPLINQLYFELSGTVLSNNTYQTLSGSGQIAAANLNTVYGPTVNGFINCTKTLSAADDAVRAVSFLTGLKPGQIGKLTGSGDTLLLCSVRWSEISSQPVAVPPALDNGLNPWRYVSTGPTNNPGTFDLWVDIPIAGKIYRVSNWSQKEQVY